MGERVNRGRVVLVGAIALVVFGSVAMGAGFFQRETAWLATSSLSSDAAGEEYRQAQSDRQAAREYEEQKRELELERERLRSEGLRVAVVGGLVVFAGAVVGIGQIARSRRQPTSVALKAP